MKKILFIIALFTITAGSARAQINLEHEFSWLSAASVNLPTLGYKYYAMDAINNKCIIYNTDYTIYKQINIPVPSGFYLVDLQFLSENLFNTDPKLEFLYVIYKFDSTLGYGMYSTRIMNETGTQLLQVDGGGYSVVYPAAQGSKLFIWMYDFSISLYSIATRVYGLPGTLTSSQVLGPDNSGEGLLPYPNPAKDYVLIPIPKAMGQGNLAVSLTNTEGRVTYFNQPIIHANLIRLPTQLLSPGTYFFRITNNNKIIHTGKLLIAK